MPTSLLMTHTLRTRPTVVTLLIVLLCLVLLGQFVVAGSGAWQPSHHRFTPPGPSFDFCSGGAALPC